MPLNLYDYLTPLDNKRIENFVKTYGTYEYIGNEEYLVDWKENNKKLFRLLGGNLIYSTQIEIDKDSHIVESEMRQAINSTDIDSMLEDLYYENMRQNHENHLIDPDCWDPDWTSVVRISILIENKLNNAYTLAKQDPDTGEIKFLKITPGMKTIKAIRKIIDFLAPDDKKLHKVFEEFRIKHSMVLNDKKLRGKLCFSIHPLDFMTMSDNDSKWSSCMTWTDAGCYHTGTVEMMNSNMVICAYLESEKPYNFSPEFARSDDEEWIWNNKKWRQLFYCNKSIIVGGKAYPYRNDALTKLALEMLRNLAWENWNQKYQYGIEQYRDMIHINTLHKMENNRMWARGQFRPIKHNIIFDTKAMYNDIFNDKRTPYWCIRNKVKKNVMFNLSGKVRCARCGEYNVVDPVDFDYVSDYYDENITEEDIDDYNSQYSGTKRILCSDCYELNRCGICENETRALPTVAMPVPYYTTCFDVDSHYRKTKVCKNCFITKFAHCPTCNQIFDTQELRYRSYASIPFGIFTEVEELAPLSTRKYIDPLEPKKGCDRTEHFMMFMECPSCNARRIRHSKVLKMPLTAGIPDGGTRDIHINPKVLNPKDKDVQKYFYENLKFCTEEEFENLRKCQNRKRLKIS